MPSPRLNRLVSQACSDATEAAASGTLPKFAKRLMMFADREVATCQAEAASVWKAACRKGCNSCCYRLVEATLPEVLLIAEHVLLTSTAEQLGQWQARYAAAESANAPLWRDEVSRPSAPCPFLVDEACSIYDLRPIACRSANNDDATACQTFYRGEGPSRMNPLRSQLDVSMLGRATIIGSQEAGVAGGLYELAPAVSAVLQNDHLNGNSSELEKVKVFSERSSIDEALPDALSRFYKDPVARDLAKFHGAEPTSEFRRRLAPYKGTAFFALHNLRMPRVYESLGQSEDEWASLDSRLIQFESYEGDQRELFEMVQGFSLFSLAYADADVRPVMERFMSKLHRVALRCMPEVAHPIESRRKLNKFRLGFIGSRIQNFNGSRWALGVLGSKHPDVESHVINLGHREDATSFCFRRAADYYWHLPYPVTQIAAGVRALNLDALIFTDVGMDGKSLQLACLRLARTQLAGWGHPVSTGSPTMDGYLSSVHMEPVDGDTHYSERLIRLQKNGLSTPFRQLRPAPSSSSELGLPSDSFLLFGQLLHKIHPSVDPLFREIATSSSIPLVILGARGEQEMAIVRQRIGSENILYLPVQSLDRYLRIVQMASASLESPSFGGAFSTLDALSLGTPVISLPGRFMRQRLSRGFLIEGGVPRLIASNDKEYVSLCLSSDRRQEAMEGLSVEPLYENGAAIQEMYETLLSNSS